MKFKKKSKKMIAILVLMSMVAMPVLGELTRK